MGCTTLSSKTFPSDDTLLKLMEKYQLTIKETKKLWKTFSKLDKKYFSFRKSGIINADEIFKILKIKPDSILAPYLIDYISDLEKDDVKTLSFPEFIRLISKLCLFTPTQIMQCNKNSVVFKCIDENKDNCLSKDEIIFFFEKRTQWKKNFSE